MWFRLGGIGFIHSNSPLQFLNCSDCFRFHCTYNHLQPILSCIEHALWDSFYLQILLCCVQFFVLVMYKLQNFQFLFLCLLWNFFVCI
jgi:hypothetical protein